MPLDKPALLACARDYIARWGCTPDGEAFFTQASLLWPLRRNQQWLMLKIADADDDEAHGADMLALYHGEGAVRVAARDGVVQLLERARTGGHEGLEQMALSGRDDEALHMLCDVVDRLHMSAVTRPRPAHLLPLRHRLHDLYTMRGQGGLYAEACAMADALCADETGWLPLHGDMHHNNVLHDVERGWLAIDPKGVWGPRAYEYANLLCNPYLHTDFVADAGRMARQAEIVAMRAALSRQAILTCVFVHAMVGAAWARNPKDKAFALACAETASQLLP